MVVATYLQHQTRGIELGIICCLMRGLQEVSPKRGEGRVQSDEPTTTLMRLQKLPEAIHKAAKI